MEDLEKKIKWEKRENLAFQVGSYVAGVVAVWSIGLGTYLYSDNNYSNSQISTLFVNAFGLLALGYVCNGASKRGKVIVSKLEEELNRRK